MRKKHRKLLDRSFAWIRTNLHATNLDVPEEFVAEWMFEDEDEDVPRPAGFFFSVFAFGYMQYEVVTKGGPAGEPRSVPMNRLVQTFELWQMKLALAAIHRKTPIAISPLPLFGFPDDEEVRYWPRCDPAAPGEKGMASTAT